MSDPSRMTEPGNPPRKAPDEPEHWLVRSDTIRKLWIGSSVVLAIMVSLDFFVDHYEYFGIDATFGFYAWYGFVTCVIMVVAAKLLGVPLKRDDDYYDGGFPEGVARPEAGDEGSSEPREGGAR